MTLRRTLFGLGGFVGFAYLAIAVVGALWPGHWDEASATDEILWNVFLIGGGVLLLAGLRLLDRSPRAGAALVAIGAFAGALPIFWALLPLLVAATLTVLAVRYARRRPASEA